MKAKLMLQLFDMFIKECIQLASTVPSKVAYERVERFINKYKEEIIEETDVAEEDKEIREFIFKIDMMGTTEFCNFVGMAVPYYKSGKTHSELAQEFITVEAIKCKTIIEFAKTVKRRKK